MYFNINDDLVNPVKKCSVLWSGGSDSTSLVYNLLKRGITVNTYYIELRNNPDKTKRELEARSKILPMFEKIGNITDHGIVASLLVSPGTSFLCQGMAWALLGVLSPDDDIALGYVMGDDAISFISEFKSIQKSYNKLRESPQKLHYPLIKNTKKHWYDLLPLDIKKLITWCEYKNDDNCSCKPCTRMNLILDLESNKKELKCY